MDFIIRMQKLFSQLNPLSILITANKRFATRIHKEYHDYQLTQHKLAWPTIQALSLNGWLQKCWQDRDTRIIEPHLTLLNPAQEQILWQNIIAQNNQQELLQIPATAAHAQQAWSLLKQWNITLDNDSFNDTIESRSFIAWAQQFKNYCQDKNLIDIASIPSILQQNFNQKLLPVPKHIILLGFVELTPNIKQLFTTLQQLSCNIDHYQIPSTPNSAYHLNLPDTKEEIYTMARWAKNLVHKSKQQTIACVAPKLNSIRNDLERIFTEVFNNHPKMPLSFNISSGNSLINEPIIHAAFSILHLHNNKLLLDNLSLLLNSPFIGAAQQEYANRALFDSKLRETQNTHINLNILINILTEEEQNSPTSCPQLLTLLEELRLNINQPSQSPNSWSKTFSNQLISIGWPGDRPLDSREYQATQRWLNLLMEFSSLNLITKKCDFSQALFYLRQLAQNTIFQPQTIDDQPIQILGLLEATGMPFDHTWIMGLDDTNWPPSPNPNPFIPKHLQHELNMPHSSAKRELEFSQLITQQFIENSKNVILSYASQQKDQTLQASPLIQRFPKASKEKLALANFNPIPKQLLNNSACQTINTNHTPITCENEKIRGGTRIFKYQASCPFRAFAELRLHSKPFPTQEIGISALERGRLLHKALELIWRNLKNQKNLLLLTNLEINNLILKKTSIAIKEIMINRFLPSGFIELEQNRLQKLLHEWLAIEKTREPFTVIALEKWQHVTIDKLAFRVQIDRVDKLADGTYILIDYKTGKTTIKSWLDSRPDEPQLPLYATNIAKPLSAIAFAQIRADEICFKSVGNRKNILPLSEFITDASLENLTWNQQLKKWQITLEKLAQNFYKGNTEISPKYGNRTCQQCHLQALCRINEI